MACENESVLRYEDGGREQLQAMRCAKAPSL